MVFEPMTLRALLSRRVLYRCTTTTALVVLVYGGLFWNFYVCVTHISKRVLASRLADIYLCSSGHDIFRKQLESPVPIRVYHCLCWVPQVLKELRARYNLRNNCVRVSRFKIKLFRVFLKQKRQKRHWNEMRQVPWLFETRNKRVGKSHDCPFKALASVSVSNNLTSPLEGFHRSTWSAKRVQAQRLKTWVEFQKVELGSGPKIWAHIITNITMIPWMS